MDRRKTAMLLATSGTLAGALLARRTLLGERSGERPTGGDAVDLTTGVQQADRQQSASGRRRGRPTTSSRPGRFGWRSHAPMPDAAARSRVRVRAGGPAGIFAPADPHPGH